MSTTLSTVDARGYLAGWLNAVTAMTIADINAIPDEKWTMPFGGCSRPANALLADTVTMLRWTIGALKGEESAAYNEMDALAGEFSDKAKGIASLNETVATFAHALTSASDEALNSTVMTPWQMPTPLFMIATIAVNHIWYHDGQFNYIQCMLGDEKVHWMGD